MDGKTERDRLMTAEEVATYLGYALGTIYNKVQAGEIPHKRLGRTIRFRRSDIDAWIEEHAQAARASA